ncbi:MAG: hypothetical protein VYA51_12730 [Planctomycetota bacterium]|nr:hypothetical protein [Planctomycetota bacterium]
MPKIIDRGMAAHLRRLQELEQLEVVAGHIGATSIEPHPKSPSVSKGQVAKFIQHGTDRMPARPFMDLAAQDLQSDTKLRGLNERAIKTKGRRAAPNAVQALRPLGARTARAIKRAIVKVGAVDTGATRDAVRYQIRSKDGRILDEGEASQ